MQGYCQEPAPLDDYLLDHGGYYNPFSATPQVRSDTQCVVTVSKNFLEVFDEGARLWVHNLYVRLEGVEKNHSSVVSVHGGDVYLTSMTFVGGGIAGKEKARAINVRQNRRLYVSSACAFLRT